MYPSPFIVKICHPPLFWSFCNLVESVSPYSFLQNTKKEGGWQIFITRTFPSLINNKFNGSYKSASS